MINFNERFEKTRKTVIPTNCIGSALYYSGKRDIDRFCPSDHFYPKYFNDLVKIEDFEKGCFVAWESRRKESGKDPFPWSKVNEEERYLHHLAVVSSINPPALIHRPGAWVEDFGNAYAKRGSLEDVDKGYHGEDVGLVLYNWKK